MEPTMSPHLKIGKTILIILTLSLCAFPVLMAEPSPSADSHPCQTDVNCELGRYCSASGKCIPCAQCSIYSRLPKQVYRQCAKSFSECGPCIPGFTVKEESGGKSSRRCSPINEVFSDFFATSTTSAIASVSKNSSSSELFCIELGGILIGILVAFAACYEVLRL